MPPKWAAGNRPPVPAVKANQRHMALPRPAWVGFGGRFGVKIAGLWAFWGRPAPYFDSAKCLKKRFEWEYAANVTDITPAEQERH